MLQTRSPFFLNPSVFAALESAVAQFDNTQYPPHNIVKTGEDEYHIEMALAGFTIDQIGIKLEGNRLTVSGKAQEGKDEGRSFLHRGIATRSFDRHYTLGDHIVVKSAEMKDGLLDIKLEREVPEHAKPRQIEIQRPN